MAWESFNDIYVPNTGGSIEGDLEVSGNLTVNDGSGNGTTYDVASEITDLKDAWDSVSQVKSYSLENDFELRMVGKIAHLSWYNNTTAWSSSWTQAATLPDGIVPAVDTGFYTSSLIGDGSVCGVYVGHDGSIQVRVYGASTTNLYGSCTFICA